MDWQFYNNKLNLRKQYLYVPYIYYRRERERERDRERERERERENANCLKRSHTLIKKKYLKKCNIKKSFKKNIFSYRSLLILPRKSQVITMRTMFSTAGYNPFERVIHCLSGT